MATYKKQLKDENGNNIIPVTLNDERLVYLDTKTLSNSEQTIDIRYYFCNKVSGTSASVVYDEILFVVNGKWSETQSVHYLRFGNSSTPENRASRNSIALVSNNSEVLYESGDSPNIPFSSRVAISEKITILPFDVINPSVASDLNTFTMSNVGGPLFGSGGGRMHFGSLYRTTASGTYSGINMFVNDTATISGTLKIYGIKYPTV